MDTQDGFALKTDAGSDAGAREDLARMLREGQAEAFNAWVAEHGPADLTDTNLRMADLRGANLTGACLRGAYLRAADLRGQDLSACDLDGASLSGAKVSGVRFPDDLSADEIMMSLAHGTRLRARRP
jgi:Pentapeptide repeats (8 copies)